MSPGIYWMTVAAADTNTNYPSDGYGGVTTSFTSAFKNDSTQRRILGIRVLTSDGSANTVTVTAANGEATAPVLQASAAVGSSYSLPEYADETAAASSTAGQLTFQPLGGIISPGPFTVAQSNAAWSIKVYFAMDYRP